MISRRRLFKSTLLAAGYQIAQSRLGAKTSPSRNAVQTSATVAPESGRRGPLPKRGNKYLFIDDHDIEAIDNLDRRLHQPQKFARNVVIRPEYRWENVGIQIRTTPVWLPDENIFKMIYHGSAEGPDPGGYAGCDRRPPGRGELRLLCHLDRWRQLGEDVSEAL